MPAELQHEGVFSFLYTYFSYKASTFLKTEDEKLDVQGFFYKS